MDNNEVYNTLKSLSHRRILHFIPRRKVPVVCYTRQREEGRRLVITRDVYEDRKDSYVKRIGSMVDYATNSAVCRSRQLLRYFGETSTADCGQCDVCRPHRSEKTSGTTATARILEMLADRRRHHLTELHALQMPKDQLDEALATLVSEEQVHVDGAYLLLAR